LVLHCLAIVVFGLMCGSELNVAVLTHPLFNRQSPEAHVRVRAGLAALMGRVVPFWMVSSTLLCLLLLLPCFQVFGPPRRLVEIAAAIQVAAVVFSLLGPVPINNRIARWTLETRPNDWNTQERRWDLYHWIRTFGLLIGFTLLVISLGLR
jgi:hypothetical protein